MVVLINKDHNYLLYCVVVCYMVEVLVVVPSSRKEDKGRRCLYYVLMSCRRICSLWVSLSHAVNHEYITASKSITITKDWIIDRWGATRWYLIDFMWLPNCFTFCTIMITIINDKYDLYASKYTVCSKWWYNLDHNQGLPRGFKTNWTPYHTILQDVGNFQWWAISKYDLL